VNQPIAGGVVMMLRVLPEGLLTASAAIEALTARLATVHAAASSYLPADL
jgi:hypothetical protein